MLDLAFTILPRTPMDTIMCMICGAFPSQPLLPLLSPPFVSKRVYPLPQPPTPTNHQPFPSKAIDGQG